MKKEDESVEKRRACGLFCCWCFSSEFCGLNLNRYNQAGGSRSSKALIWMRKKSRSSSPIPSGRGHRIIWDCPGSRGTPASGESITALTLSPERDEAGVDSYHSSAPHAPSPKRPCSLSRTETVIHSPKFGVHIEYIYQCYISDRKYQITSRFTFLKGFLI